MRINALSLFSSAGIAETYFKRNGIDVKVACELLPERAKIYRNLYPDTDMVTGDLTNESTFKLVMDKAKEANVDFIIATPPCQGMSTAGQMKKDDPRNRLIIQVAESIKILTPRFVIIENVPEILRTKIFINNEWILINDYLEQELGHFYNFNQKKIVNAMNYDVAQSRLRCVYLLSRKDTNFIWEFPKPLDYIKTMRECIGDLPSLDPDVTDITDEEKKRLFPDYENKKKLGLAVSKWHYPPKHKFRHVEAMMHTPEGDTAWNNLIYFPKLKDGSKSKGYKNTYKRQWWDKPAYTITKYTSRLGSQENGHPGRILVNSNREEERIISDARTMTIFELIRLSSLPDDWNIPENTSSNLIREIIGEGVPPRLIEFALIQLKEAIKDEF